MITSINAKGRDNARRPMQWTGAEGAGFSTGQAWLAFGDTVKDINVEKHLQINNRLSIPIKN